MKTGDLIRHLRKHGCRLLIEGGRHTRWLNPVTGAKVPVARHKEISNVMANIICRQLGIPDIH